MKIEEEGVVRPSRIANSSLPDASVMTEQQYYTYILQRFYENLQVTIQKKGKKRDGGLRYLVKDEVYQRMQQYGVRVGKKKISTASFLERDPKAIVPILGVTSKNERYVTTGELIAIPASKAFFFDVIESFQGSLQRRAIIVMNGKAEVWHMFASDDPSFKPSRPADEADISAFQYYLDKI